MSVIPAWRCESKVRRRDVYTRACESPSRRTLQLLERGTVEKCAIGAGIAATGEETHFRRVPL